MKRILRNLCAGLIAAGCTLVPVAASAADDPGFAAWRAELRAEVLARGISAETFDAAFAGVTPDPKIIKLDRFQPETTKTFAQYRKGSVSAARVAHGRRMLAENRAVLEEVGARYGVQPRFIVALWGLETDYGRYPLSHYVITALATLAYDDRRPEMFRRHLHAALRILDEGHISVADMRGSWAGAMGQNQFMPETFLSYATDHDGDGHKDIWNTRADVFASAANYLSRVGWRDDITWGRQVTLPAGFDMALASQRARGPFTRKRLSEWQALGVRRSDGSDLPTRDIEAAIVLPDGPGGDAYMVYANYHALLDWNTSLYFATSIGLLSDRIAGR